MRECESLIRLPQLILPHRFQRIRRIQFSTAFDCPVPTAYYNRKLYPPDDASKWPKACSVLASMNNLERLHITVALPARRDGVYGNNSFDDSLIFILESLKPIRARRFVLNITAHVPDYVLERVGSLPCEIESKWRHDDARSGIRFVNWVEV